MLEEEAKEMQASRHGKKPGKASLEVGGNAEKSRRSGKF